MTNFKIATWNVNSLRVRLSHVQQWLRQNQPDVLALQELKLTDADFPLTEFAELGYEAVVSGQKTYNGVAVLSRQPGVDVVKDMPGLDDPQRRVLAVTVSGVRVINLYVPNGESVTSEKYQYKLNWLKHLDQWLQQSLTQYDKVVVLGDFNIAPEAIDVHDPAEWEGHVLFSEPERRAFQDILQLGFRDAFREHCGMEKAYSWWDYRMNAFRRNKGLRIDHILISEELLPRLIASFVDRFPRTQERPSDHAPVIAEFKLP